MSFHQDSFHQITKEEMVRLYPHSISGIREIIEAIKEYRKTQTYLYEKIKPNDFIKITEDLLILFKFSLEGRILK